MASSANPPTRTGDPVPSVFQPDCLEGQVALITGGGTGIGRGIALWLSRHGAHVVLASRDPDHLEPTAAEIRGEGLAATAMPMDVRDRERVDEAVGRIEADLGGVDILVNNAAGNFLVPAAELSEGGWRAVLDIVLTGTFHLSQAVFPGMRRKGGGSIVNITTTYVGTGAPWMSHSGAAKAGVLNLTRSLAAEWGPDGIRVNAVAPGLVEGTEGSRRLVESVGLADLFESAIVLDRMTRVDDVAQAVLFLCTRAAAQITGEEIVVDGGSGLGGRFKEVRRAIDAERL